MTCRSGVVSVAIVVRTARTTASVLTPEPISLRARTERSGRVLYARRACASPALRGRDARGRGTWTPQIRASAPCTTIFPRCRQCSSSRATPTSWGPTRLSLRARQLASAWTCACAWSRGLPRLRPVRPLHSRGRGRPGPQRSLRDGHSQEPLRPRVSRTFHGLVGGRDEAVEETGDAAVRLNSSERH